MASPRKKKTETSAATAKLAEAFEFVSPAYKEGGEDYMQHCRLINNQVIAFNGIIGFGHPIDEDIAVCPHLGKALAAIKRAGKTLAITELDSGRLAFRGDNLRVIVPCIAGDAIPAVMPDPRCGNMNDEIIKGFAAINPLVKEGDANIRWIETAALLRANTIVATNGHVLLEYWHGIDLPPGLTVPKIAINALSKIKKPLVGFGFGRSSVTFYFDDGAWMRSQTFTDEYPDVDRLTGQYFGQRGPQDVAPVPPTLFDAVAAVSPFCEGTSAIYLGSGVVKSHPTLGDTDVGASHPVEGLNTHLMVDHNYMKLIAPMATRISFEADELPIIFFGDRIRGLVMKMRI